MSLEAEARAAWGAPLPDPARPVLIAGPTASGKSALALALAEAQGREVVNADALQVHAAFRVLTARPSPQDEARAPHRLYGHVPWGTAYSVGDWLRDVAPVLARRPAPVVVGGTGLFLSTLTEGLADVPPIPPEVREVARRRAEGDLPALVAELDVGTAARIDLANPARVARAWEVLQATGRPLAAWQDATPPPLLPPNRAETLVIEAPKAWLGPRIEARFDAMLAAAALDEVRAVLPRWDPDAPAARAIGAPELVAHIRGTLTLEEARERAIVATRRYAKRQRTWFRSRMDAWRRRPASDRGMSLSDAEDVA